MSTSVKSTRLSNILKLANPEPKNFDAELDEELLSGIQAKLTENDNDEDNEDSGTSKSQLRLRNVPLLDEFDDRYLGKITSRKSLKEPESALENPDISLDTYDDGDESIGEESLDDNDDDDEINSHLKDSDVNDDDDDDDEDDGNNESIEEDDDMDQNNESLQRMRVKNRDEVSDNLNKGVKTFSDSSLEHDITRGKAIRSQLVAWDNLLEMRIRIQKVLSVVNRLPQPDTWQSFKEAGGQDFNTCTSQCISYMTRMLQNLTSVQTYLMGNTDQSCDTSSDRFSKVEESDEEINSDGLSGNESDTGTEKQTPKSCPPFPAKRKSIAVSEIPNLLSKRHKSYASHRNEVIQRWSEKTRLATGKYNSKSFAAFYQPVIKQIEQILNDRERLIKRTQVKRSSYDIIGKPTVEDAVDNVPNDLDDPPSRLREVQVETDPNIFDDDDFYHQLLRELIQQKCSDIDDPAVLSRHMSQIQRLRNKAKRNVDTSASKGRKLRYNVHQKMVSFMAPMDTSSWTDQSKDDLFKSLFGKISDTQSDSQFPDTVRII